MSAGAFALGNHSSRARLDAGVHPWTTAEVVAFVVNVAIAVAIVVHFHNRFWWAPDEGAFAYVADRMLQGDILNRDIHDIHGGYIHFVNAFALDWFGRDFVSLRYPLAFFAVVESCLVFWLLRPALGAAAALGGIAMAALTFVQFINPTPNWYALFLTVAIVVALARRSSPGLATLAGVGFLIGMVFLFRQLSGVFVAIGVVAYLLHEERPARTEGPPVIARCLAVAMAVGLAAYLWLKTDTLAFVLFGAFPLGVLVTVALRTRIYNAAAMAMVGALAVGALVAALPLLVYHVAHGSLGGWWHDAWVSAVSLTGLDFFRSANYARLVVLAANELATSNPVAMANGLFWLIVMLSPLVLGLAVLWALWRRQTIAALPFVAVFYALVAAHFAIPIYAVYPIALVLAGLLVIAPAGIVRAGAAAVAVFAIVIGLVFQAGQPLTRGLAGIARGERVALSAAGPPGASIRITSADSAMYRALLAFIDEHASPGQSILALPMSPELYFLSDRPAAIRFPIAPLGLRTDTDVANTWRELQTDMPGVVIFGPDDKYATPPVRQLMALIESKMQKCARVGPYELFATACRT